MARGQPLPILSTLFFALVLAASSAHGAALISDADGPFLSANLSPQMDYFVDRAGAMNYHRIQELPDAAWVPVNRDVISFGFSEEVYWFRTTIRNASAVTEFTLHAGNQTFDTFDVYHVKETRARLASIGREKIRTGWQRMPLIWTRR